MGTAELLNISHLIWPMLFSLGLSAILTYGIIHFAPKWGWVDTPDHRSSHTRIVPTMGGIAIVISFLLSSLVFLNLDLKVFTLLGSVFILGTIGALDDKLDLSAKSRLLVQICLAAIIAWSYGLSSFMPSLLGFSIPVHLSILLSVFLIVAYINAFNFIDGIDGLSGSFTVVACAALLLGYTALGSSSFMTMQALLLAATCGFLIFNWPPAKIFMGDSGSTVLGLLLVVGALELHSSLSVHPSLMTGYHVILPFVILIIPIFDLVRTILFRKLRGQGILVPDKTHLHHLLIKTGLDHLKATVLIILLQLVLIVSGIFIIQKFTVLPTVVILSVIAIASTEGITIFFWLFNYKNYKRTQEDYRIQLPNDNQFIERNI